MSAQAGPKVLASDKSVIVQEGEMLRNRVPAVIVTALGAQSKNDAIDWQVQELPGGQKLAIGVLIPNGRSQVAHTPPAAKKSAKKAAAPQVPGVPQLPPPLGLPSGNIFGGPPAHAYPVPPTIPSAPQVILSDDDLEDDDEYEEEVNFQAPAPNNFLTGAILTGTGPIPLAAPPPPPAPAAGKSAKKGRAKKGGKKSAKKGGVAYSVPGAAPTPTPVPAAPQVPAGLAGLFGGK